MSVKFIKNGQIYDSGDCIRNLNLLAHSQLIELFIGSECGGHGRCGLDRVQVSPEDFQKINRPTAIEKAHLSAEQLDGGLRLACQAFPEADDLEIRVQVIVKGEP